MNTGALTLKLPKPLSTNSLFKNKRSGRACTEVYNAWKWRAKAMIQEQKPLYPPQAPVTLTFLVGEKGFRKDADGDNCFKCLIDALVDAHIIEDDNRSIVRGVSMEWVPGVEGATAIIESASHEITTGW